MKTCGNSKLTLHTSQKKNMLLSQYCRQKRYQRLMWLQEAAQLLIGGKYWKESKQTIIDLFFVSQGKFLYDLSLNLKGNSA